MNARLCSSPSGGISLALAAVSVACALVSAACGTSGQAFTADQPARSRQIIVVVDFSGSRSDTELDHSREMIQGLVHRLEPGDQMAILPVAGGGAKRRPARLHEIPDDDGGKRRESRRLERARGEIREEVDALFADRASMSREATDLLATLFHVRDYVFEAQRRDVDLVILSDMIQDASGLNFTQSSGVPADTWIAARHAKELVARLEKVCVTVVGADSSTPAGVARRTFWQRYFAAAGAVLATERYRQTLTQFDGALCGSRD